MNYTEGIRVINVLIVEDDLLVRKGLVSAMPWHDFNMRVVGEANNGKKALEFLRQNKVDLILTDLNMPVMSGIDFMKVARQKYPHIFIAILTIHQDFEYIQQALRLGAIDFITKVQLEKENFGPVLNRIYQRIMEEKAQEYHYEQAVAYETDECIALYSMRKIKTPETEFEKIRAIMKEFHQIDEQIFLIFGMKPVSSEEFIEYLMKHSHWKPVKITGLKGRYQHQVHSLLIEYKERFFFYETETQKTLSTHSLETMEKQIKDSHKHFYKMRKKILTFEWVFNDKEFFEFEGKLLQHRLSPETIHQLMSEAANEWKRKFVTIPSSCKSIPNTFKNWGEVKNWLTEFRSMAGLVAGNKYSGDVVNSILEAITLMQDNLGESVTAESLARQVNMSRSYFNKCFKDITGTSFHQYLKTLRLEKAKNMLLRTNESIYWIAEKTGYLDEKYFSKIFKEETGKLPSEFRKMYREVKNELDK